MKVFCSYSGYHRYSSTINYLGNDVGLFPLFVDSLWKGNLFGNSSGYINHFGKGIYSVEEVKNVPGWFFEGKISEKTR